MNYTTEIKLVTLYSSLLQKIKERNNKSPRRLLVDHKRGQKCKNSWTATEEGSLTEMHREPLASEVYASEGDAGKTTTVPDHKQRHNWEGKRGWCVPVMLWEMPAAAQGEASNRWRCSNRHNGQQMAKPPKLPSLGSCRHWSPSGGLPLMQVHFFTSRNGLVLPHKQRTGMLLPRPDDSAHRCGQDFHKCTGHVVALPLSHPSFLHK